MQHNAFSHTLQDAHLQPCLNMAQHAAVCHSRAAAERLDLAQEAVLGLVECRQRYDADRGTQLSTFAWSRMRGRAWDAVRREARYLRVCAEWARQPDVAYSGATISTTIDVARMVDRVSPDLRSNERAILESVYGGDQSLRDLAAQGRWSEDQLQRAHARLLSRLRQAAGVSPLEG